MSDSNSARRWHRLFPPAQWFAGYQARWLKSDLVAGVTLAAYAVPVSMAYAGLAGLPPHYGIYCYLLGGLCYALFGTSRQLAVGPTSAISMLVGATVADMAGGDATRWAEIAGLTALVMAGLSILAWLLRLSGLVSFISETILVGFKAGAALTIAMTQLPKLFGVSGGGEHFFHRVWTLAGQLGAGAVLESAGSALPPGELHMACGENGYVGLVVAERGRLVVAAALDPAAVAEAGGVGPAAASIVARAGLPPIAALAQARWLATPPLTRRATTLAAHRAFVLGDAAGFVEPFTGEGLAWALTAARAVQPFARAAARAWDDDLIAAWTARWRATVARRQRLCRGLAWTLRHPLAVRAAVAALSSHPQLGAPLLSRLGAAAP